MIKVILMFFNILEQKVYKKNSIIHYKMVILLLLTTLFEINCQGKKSNHPSVKKEPSVIIILPGERFVRIKVELARTESERAKGLMFREKLEKGSGMLFIFEKPEIQTFWMKNTYIPLDMIFIDSDLRIAGIIENAEPLTLTPRKISKKSQYVLEVEGGFCQKYNIESGMKVIIEGLNEL